MQIKKTEVRLSKDLKAGLIELGVLETAVNQTVNIPFYEFQFLESLFPWVASKEGLDFWLEVRDKLENLRETRELIFNN